MLIFYTPVFMLSGQEMVLNQQFNVLQLNEVVRLGGFAWGIHNTQYLYVRITHSNFPPERFFMMCRLHNLSNNILSKAVIQFKF